MGRTAQARLLERALCARDLLHWCNYWCWTYDPREQVSTLPFDLFPRQAELLGWLAQREAAQEEGLIEKSRDMGATWLCVAYALHGWLYRDGYAVGFGSRKEMYVDELGNPDSILEKARILLDNLPAWMLPRDYVRGKHAGFCKIVNPESGATLTGEAGDHIGRGGRKSIYFIDEAAYLPHAELIERSLSQTTRCRIDVSTPNGPGNPFARRRFGGRVAVFTLHWKDDPRKGQDWYEKTKASKDPVTVAQEIDIDYTASVEGITIPAAWVRAAVNLSLPASGAVQGGYDVAEEGKDLSVLLARQGPVVTADRIASWGRCNTTEGAWRARDEAQRMGCSSLNYDAGGPGMGTKGTWQTATSPLPFAARAVQFGGAPSDTVWPDGQTSAEKFLNLRAEMWWLLRARFERAYEFVTRGVQHRPEDMISIPDHPQLVAELSQPLSFRTDAGKIKLESKEDMRRRGVSSPNYADALALSFLPAPIAHWTMGADPAGQSEVAKAPRGVFLS